MGDITVVNVAAGSITSSPGVNNPAFSNAVRANKLAEEPELQPKPYFVPIYSAYSFSNCFTFGPCDIHTSRRESRA